MAASTDPTGAVESLAPTVPGSSFGRRALSGAFLVPASVLLAHVGGWWFTGALTLVCVVATSEFYYLLRGAGAAPDRVWMLLGAAAVPLAFHAAGPGAFLPVFLAFAGGALVFALKRRPHPVPSAAATILAIVYVPLPLGHFALLRNGHAWGGDGFQLVLLVFVLTWTCDTAAYVVGRAIGRHRPWPALSPKKTVEGAVGGILFTLFAAIVGRSWLAPELTLGAAIVLGFVVGVLCPIGDLVESLFKRQAGVKDSSTLIPGHGGLLDRVDSMLFSAPATYYVLALTAWLH